MEWWWFLCLIPCSYLSTSYMCEVMRKTACSSSVLKEQESAASLYWVRLLTLAQPLNTIQVQATFLLSLLKAISDLFERPALLSPPGLNNVNINLLPSWCVWGIICIDSWKKGNAKECSDYWKIALSSHSSKVMLKILQVRLQQYVNWELPDVQVGFRKGRGTRDQIANICWIIEKAREF